MPPASTAGGDAPPDGKPRGTLVGQALVLPPEPNGGPFRVAVDAIDRLHGDGSLSTIVVRRQALPLGQEGLYDAAPPFAIVVAERARHPALTLLHEIGHVLDHHTLGGSVPFASVSEPALSVWRAAIRNSRAFIGLMEIVHVTAAPDILPMLRYLVRPEELWARSYAQYVASRSDEPDLAAELQERRRRLAPRVYIPRQWDDDDFSPIADAINDVFWRRGWIG